MTDSNWDKHVAYLHRYKTDKYSVVVEDDYSTSLLPEKYTRQELHDKLQSELSEGEDIDTLTPTLWILKDEGGCPIRTYKLMGEMAL